MTTLGTIASLNTSNIEVTTSPTSGIRVVNEKFTRTPGRAYPIVSMVGYGEATKFNANDRKVEWMYERTMKAVVTGWLRHRYPWAVGHDGRHDRQRCGTARRPTGLPGQRRVRGIAEAVR
jgi:hypothetical protein